MWYTFYRDPSQFCIGDRTYNQSLADSMTIRGCTMLLQGALEAPLPRIIILPHPLPPCVMCSVRDVIMLLQRDMA